MNILEPEDEEHTQEEDSSGSNDDEDSQDEEEEEEEEEEEDQVGVEATMFIKEVLIVILKTHGYWYLLRMTKKEMRTMMMKDQRWSWMKISLTLTLLRTSALKGLTGMMTSS